MIAILLAIITIVPSCAETFTGSCGTNVTYSLDTESGLLKIEGTGEIPNYSSSGAPWYSRRQTIKEVIISGGITSIGKYAFYSCDSVTSVTINGAITSIGESVFANCSKLANINLPESLTNLGVKAFQYCRSLTSITLPNSLANIGNYAFAWCSNLTSVTMPNSLTYYNSDIFWGCPLTTPLYNSKTFFDFYPKSYSGEYKIPEGIETIYANAFSGCANLSSVTIPSSVTSIGDNAFSGCYFIKEKFVNNSACTSDYNWGATICDVIQEDGLMIIGNTAIKCKTTATSVKIPNNIKIIASRAFENCSSLTSISIPLSVDSIGEYAFRNCTSLPVIDNLRYADCYLVEAIYEKGVYASFSIKEGTRFIGSLGGEGYGYCLTGITIPNTVVKICDRAFAYCM